MTTKIKIICTTCGEQDTAEAGLAADPECPSCHNRMVRVGATELADASMRQRSRREMEEHLCEPPEDHAPDPDPEPDADWND